MKKYIKTDKEVETYLFCQQVKKKAKAFDDRFAELMSKEELDDLQGGLKVLNLEDDEDISHHRQQLNQFNDRDGFNEDVNY